MNVSMEYRKQGWSGYTGGVPGVYRVAVRKSLPVAVTRCYKFPALQALQQARRTHCAAEVDDRHGVEIAAVVFGEGEEVIAG